MELPKCYPDPNSKFRNVIPILIVNSEKRFNDSRPFRSKLKILAATDGTKNRLLKGKKQYY